MLILIQNNDLGISCVVEQSLFTFLIVTIKLFCLLYYS